MLLISLLVAFFVTIFLYKRHIKKYEDIDKLPGPSTFQFLRDLYKASSSKGAVSYFLSLNDKYGPVVRVWINPFMPTIFTTDLEYVNKIFKDQRNYFSPSFLDITFAENGIGSNPNYETWKHDKQVINERIMNKEYISELLKIYSKKYDGFINKIREKGQVDVEEPLRLLFLEALFGYFHHPSTELTNEDIQQFSAARNEFFDYLLEKMNSFFIPCFYIFTRNYKESMKNHNFLTNFTTNWLKRFKSIEKHLRSDKNLVYTMLNSGIPDSRIVANMNTLIQAGQETMAIPLGLTFREISKQPKIQKKIFDEIQDVFGNNISTISLNDLNKLTYLHAVVKEAVRMYMTVPLVDRRLNYDLQIGNTKLPKGITVSFHLTKILKTAEYFKDPLTFNPDRFLDENASEIQKAYVAFGFGLKSCPGKQIAYAAMKLLMVKILKEFEVQEVLDHQPKFVVNFFYKNINGILIRFKKREKQ